MKIKTNKGNIRCKDIRKAANWCASEYASNMTSLDMVECGFCSERDFPEYYKIMDGKRDITAKVYELAHEYFSDAASEAASDLRQQYKWRV